MKYLKRNYVMAIDQGTTGTKVYVSNNVRNLLLANTGDPFWTKRRPYLNGKPSLFEKWLDLFTSSFSNMEDKNKEKNRTFLFGQFFLLF